MRILQLLTAAALLGAPAFGQFSITVQQNGQASNIANGSTITINAPMVGQSADATVVITYLGAGTAVFPGTGQLLGSNFTATGDGPVSLGTFQSVTVGFHYSPQVATQSQGQFLWPYNQVVVNSDMSTTTTSGALTLNLVGTAPNLVVEQVSSSGSVTPLQNGATITFPVAVVNGTSTVNLAIGNSGSGPGMINSVSTTGAAFTPTGLPLFPLTVNPGVQLNLSVQFMPPSLGVQTGTLQVNFASGSFTATLVGTGITSFFTYNVVEGSQTTPVAPGQAIMLPDANVGTTSTAVVQFQNTGTAPIVLNTIAISGQGFSLTDGPFLPVTLAPQQVNSVTVTYTPSVVGASSGRLLIGSDSFLLSAKSGAINSAFAYSLIQGGATNPLTPNQTISIPDTNVGSKNSIVVQFQNTSSSPVVLNNLGISGANLAITDAPFLPITLQPQQSNTLTLTYTPVQPGTTTGRLLIGNDSFPVTARALGASFQYSYQAGGGPPVTVAPGGVVSFSPIAVGQTESLIFTVTNTGTVTGSVSSIGIAGAASGGAAVPPGTFVVSNLPGLPLQLAPNASASFTISFTPSTAGQVNANLLIDTQSFTLTGFSSAPPTMPTQHFTGASGTQQPFQQPSIGLTLDAPYPLALSGVLTMTVTPTNTVADPAVQFSSGGRVVAFTIAPNTTQAVFVNGSTQISLQTGTLASIIQIVPTFAIGGVNLVPPSVPTLQLTVPSLAPSLVSVTISARTLVSLTLSVSGFTTTRELGHLTFQLMPASGSKLSVSTVTIDLTAQARIWFDSAQSQALGGQFTIDVPFVLSESATVSNTTDLTKNIAGASVTATNSIGTSNTASVTVP